MKKLIVLFLMVLSCSSCSLLPKVNFGTASTVPQSIDRSKLKETCKGNVKMNEVGEIISCSKGYMNYTEGYVKKERKMTIIERIKSFINGLVGWGFIGLVLLVIFVPGLLGIVIGRLVEGSVGIASTVSKRLMLAIQKARKYGKDLNEALEAELDAKDKQYIAQVKEKENIS
jgi:hypothetical protein